MPRSPDRSARLRTAGKPARSSTRFCQAPYRTAGACRHPRLPPVRCRSSTGRRHRPDTPASRPSDFEKAPASRPALHPGWSCRHRTGSDADGPLDFEVVVTTSARQRTGALEFVTAPQGHDRHVSRAVRIERGPEDHAVLSHNALGQHPIRTNGQVPGLGGVNGLFQQGESVQNGRDGLLQHEGPLLPHGVNVSGLADSTKPNTCSVLHVLVRKGKVLPPVWISCCRGTDLSRGRCCCRGRSLLVSCPKAPWKPKVDKRRTIRGEWVCPTFGTRHRC